jgi:hypothetical protein
VDVLAGDDNKSVRITLRLPEDLHVGMVERCMAAGQNISEWSRDHLEAAVHRERTRDSQMAMSSPGGKRNGLGMKNFRVVCPHPPEQQQERPDGNIWCGQCGIQLLEL